MNPTPSHAVKRYDMESTWTGAYMREHPDGDWIESEDYDKLKAEFNREAKEHERTINLLSANVSALELLKKHQDSLLASATDLANKSLGYLNSDDEVLVRLESAIAKARGTTKEGK